MTIEIKPAEIVGASIGDRVTWSHGRRPGAVRYHGTLKGVTVDDEHSLLTIEDENGEVRHVHPEMVRLAPKKYKVGDQVTPKDADHLPNGTVLTDHGFLPLFKIKDSWYVIDNYSGVRMTEFCGDTRTISWMPRIYTDNV